jgi:Transposase DDE domain
MCSLGLPTQGANPMHVEAIVRRILVPARDQIHAYRRTAMLVAVGAIIQAGRLTVAAMGRNVRGRTAPKHSIKRIDRLLSNGRLHRERTLIFSVMARWILRDQTRPVVLVDWTMVTGRFRALYAAVPIGGRAVTIYLEVHHEKKLGNARVQTKFLQRLGEILPPGCRPIIVSDAGFHGPFFRDVVALGWDFVGRLRGTAKARPLAGGAPISKEEFYARATVFPQDLGAFQLYIHSKSVPARLVLIRKPKKPGRKLPPPTSKEEIEYRRTAKDPLLVATSLTEPDAPTIIGIYATRMQIEETFRDAKNFRFGWCLRHVVSRSGKRLSSLLLLTALATLAVVLVGFAAESLGKHRGYQANTTRSRVLSFFVLGQAFIKRSDHRVLRPPVLRAVVGLFRLTICSLNFVGNPT